MNWAHTVLGFSTRETFLDEKESKFKFDDINCLQNQRNSIFVVRFMTISVSFNRNSKLLFWSKFIDEFRRTLSFNWSDSVSDQIRTKITLQMIRLVVVTVCQKKKTGWMKKTKWRNNPLRRLYFGNSLKAMISGEENELGAIVSG